MCIRFRARSRFLRANRLQESQAAFRAACWKCKSLSPFRLNVPGRNEPDYRKRSELKDKRPGESFARNPALSRLLGGEKRGESLLRITIFSGELSARIEFVTASADDRGGVVARLCAFIPDPARPVLDPSGRLITSFLNCARPAVPAYQTCLPL